MKIKNLKSREERYGWTSQPLLGTVLQEGSRCLKSDDLRYVIDTVKTGEGQGGYLDRVRVGGYRGNTDILRYNLKTLATPVRTQASTNTLI